MSYTQGVNNLHSKVFQTN